jgi:hypothetical protein
MPNSIADQRCKRKGKSQPDQTEQRGDAHTCAMHEFSDEWGSQRRHTRAEEYRCLNLGSRPAEAPLEWTNEHANCIMWEHSRSDRDSERGDRNERPAVPPFPSGRPSAINVSHRTLSPLRPTLE